MRKIPSNLKILILLFLIIVALVFFEVISIEQSSNIHTIGSISSIFGIVYIIIELFNLQKNTREIKTETSNLKSETDKIKKYLVKRNTIETIPKAISNINPSLSTIDFILSKKDEGKIEEQYTNLRRLINSLLKNCNDLINSDSLDSDGTSELKSLRSSLKYEYEISVSKPDEYLSHQNKLPDLRRRLVQLEVLLNDLYSKNLHSFD